MAIGDLVARLLCDSSNFDNNIRRSQKEVQEFKRKTEREAAAINNSFNSIGSAVGKVSPQLGNIIGSLGKVAPLAAAGTAAFGLFKQVIQQSETAMDELDKKTAQLSGAWEHITTTIGNGNIFSGMTSSLRESVRLAGQLAEIMDNLGTFSGYSKLNKSEAESNLSKLKEMIKAGASKEDINRQVEKTKFSIVKFDKSSNKIANELESAYSTVLEEFYNDIKRGGRVGLRAGTSFIEKFATNLDWRSSIVSWDKYLNRTNINQLKTDKSFEKFLKQSGLFDSYLFNNFKGGGKEGKEYIKDVISIVSGVIDKRENSKYGIEKIQETRSAWLDAEREASEMHTGLYKQMNNIINKPGKSGGRSGSVYYSKQEAPKERTLQDILDDLDKSLTWNKYLAQNLGEDITGLDTSTLEKTANELKDLLKNTTDEEQRKRIISELKTINNIINKPKEAKKPTNNANFEGIYGNEIGNLSLNNDARNQVLESAEDIKEWEKGFRESLKGIKRFKVDLDDVVPADTARKYNYNADEYFKDRHRLYGNIDEFNKNTVQSMFNVYKFSDYRFLNSGKKYKPVSDPNNKISSFIPFGELSKLNIPIKYPEEFYYEREASAKFSSGVASIVKKYTGFDTFRSNFAKNAYSKFDELISEGNIITPNDVNKILYQVYLDTIIKHTDDTPDFFKNASDFYRFIYEKTNTNFNDERAKLKVNLILGEKNKNSLLYNEILDSVGATKEAKAGFGDDLTTINAKSRSIKPINFGTDYIIGFINELSKGNIYEKARLLSEIKNKLVERREALTGLVATTDIGMDRAKLNVYYKNLRLIQLEREKRSNKGVLSEENQKEYEELKKETGNDFSSSTNIQLDTYEESFTRDSEKLAKSIEEANSIRKDLENKINQSDEIGNRIQKEEEDNNVLREKQKILSELSNEYISVADSAYQIGAAFSSLDNKFGDIASVLLNVVGITAEAIGKLIGMATAKGVSNAFQLPWPQNLAAVATVVAAGASAAGQIAGLASKKYATGGIVSGPGTGISDSIPIRVSNGEMILNHRQQSNLFNLLDKGSSTEGKIEFKNKLVGSDIIGSATIYNKRRNLIL